MSTNRLGRVENLDRYWFQNHLNSSGNQVELGEPEEDTVEPLDEVEHYPYQGQKRFRGDFQYKYSDWKDRTQTEEGYYEYRAESGLFLLDVESGRIEPEDIISELNNQFSDLVEIDGSLSVGRKPLWSFFEGADQYDELVIAGPKGRFNFNTLKRAAHTFEPGDLARLEELSETEAEAEFENPDELRRVVPLLHEIDLSKEIKSPEDLGINPYRYLIEKAVVGFRYNDELIRVEYDRGDLNIDDTASSEAREFIVELFERDVVYPSYGR